ncbi:MAG TPA: sugar phosphate isomerase/epimerase [Clostridia bacterium]|nr:sugar phosphate isomerase/epimerase [Clostridia bacterium]
MYSLSTCWNSHRHIDGRAMLREVRDLGFEYAELSHGTRISLLPGILEAVDAGEIKISSLHNFCPLPMGVNHAAPNLYQFSSDRVRERELAQRFTIKTIELAARLKASMVVLHLGSVEMKDYTEKLLEMLQRGEQDSTKYARLCAEADEKREARKKPFMDRVLEMLQKLLPEAGAHNVRLGAENRESLEELPFESDFQMLFQELNSPHLAYWHDTGHAQIKENLGFTPHLMHLESLGDKVGGFHIHDVQFPGRDHCAPGTGTLDFAALKPLVKPEHIKVFELSPNLSADEVRRGVEHLKKIWGE